MIWFGLKLKPADSSCQPKDSGYRSNIPMADKTDVKITTRGVVESQKLFRGAVGVGTLQGQVVLVVWRNKGVELQSCV